jgi:hypothetical protein
MATDRNIRVMVHAAPGAEAMGMQAWPIPLLRILTFACFGCGCGINFAGITVYAKFYASLNFRENREIVEGREKCSS